MGWTYEYRIAYGIIVDAWNNPGLKDLIKSYSDYIGYDSKMSLDGKGTIFVYVRSTYKAIDTDAGLYNCNFPDTEGTEFQPPKHPLIHKIDTDLLPPEITTDEFLALCRVKRFCKAKGSKIWIRHSFVLY